MKFMDSWLTCRRRPFNDIRFTLVAWTGESHSRKLLMLQLWNPFHFFSGYLLTRAYNGPNRTMPKDPLLFNWAQAKRTGSITVSRGMLVNCCVKYTIISKRVFFSHNSFRKGGGGGIGEDFRRVTWFVPFRHQKSIKKLRNIDDTNPNPFLLK